MMKLKSIVSALLAVGAMASANAFVLFPGLTQLEDDNREYLIKGKNALGNDNTQAGILEVGDVLRGTIKFQAVKQIRAPFQNRNIGFGSASDELTGVFETQVLSITDADSDGIAELVVFGPSAAFQSAYGVGATAALFTGPNTFDIDTCGSIAACEAAATDGALWAVAGFGDADDVWASRNSVLNFALASNEEAVTQVASINYAQSLLVNNTGYLFNEVTLSCITFNCVGAGKDGKTDLIGSGSILGGLGLTDGYGVRSDIDVTFNVVPEPGSLALVGLALAGIGLSARRRKA